MGGGTSELLVQLAPTREIATSSVLEEHPIGAVLAVSDGEANPKKALKTVAQSLCNLFLYQPSEVCGLTVVVNVVFRRSDLPMESQKEHIPEIFCACEHDGPPEYQERRLALSPYYVTIERTEIEFLFE